jgi:hypothetical protein
MTIQLNHLQQQNWSKVINYLMSDTGFKYRHEHFANPADTEKAFCILSFIFRTPNINLSLPTHLSFFEYVENEKYREELDIAFGDDFLIVFAVGESDFAEFIEAYGHSEYINIDTKVVANLLREFIGISISSSDAKHFTVQWKNNSKDIFRNEEALREFFELNPHRKNSVRRITVTKVVERIVYDEVESVFHL